MNSYKILMIEDEENICNFMKMTFETNGYQILFANTGKNGMTMFSSHHPNLLILDLGLPDVDGLEIIKEIRQKSEVPIIVLSARTDEKDKVEALDLGANDYVTKPFGTSEKFCLYDMVIQYEARKVSIAGKEVRLTQTEYNIVEVLALHAGKVLTYAEIVKKVWGYSDSGSVKKLQVNMANIRKKFGEKPGEYHYILNELGVGYRMNDDKW